MKKLFLILLIAAFGCKKDTTEILKNPVETVALFNPDGKKIFSAIVTEGKLSNIYIDAGTPAANSCLQNAIKICVNNPGCFLLCNTGGWGSCVLGWMIKCGLGYMPVSRETK